jgi:hypothetical protein
MVDLKQLVSRLGSLIPFQFVCVIILFLLNSLDTQGGKHKGEEKKREKEVRERSAQAARLHVNRDRRKSKN